MSGKKGISPLIAAVILIAFVIAVAGIASTFFTGFTREQAAGVESKATTIVDCSVAIMKLDSDTVSINSTGDNFTLVLSNEGQEDLAGLKVVFFNSSYASTCDATPSSITVGSTITIEESGSCDIPTIPLDKIQATTTTCAGVKSELTNYSVDSSGDTVWRVTA
ncbi:MAG: hypothetical protein JSV92_05240 [archaeon]|nr:MAG: hypothetical protein JSV92_05240 [archaeon]